MNQAPFFLLLLSYMLQVSSCKTAQPNKVRQLSNDITSKNDLSPDLLDDSGPMVTPLVWSPEERKANATFQYFLAQKMIVAGDVKGALPWLESAYNLDPNSYIGSQLVEARLITGAVEEAETESHRMTLLYPKDEKLRVQYAQVLIFKNDLKEAEIQFKKAIELDPKYEDPYLLLSRLYMTLKKPGDAISTVQNLVKILPGSARGWPLLARLLVSQRRFKDALEPAKRSWQLSQGQPESAFVYGLALDLNGRSKEAVALYEQIYKLNPANQDLIQRMVSLYQDLGNMEEALSLVDEMISKTKESHPSLIMQRAIILSELNRNDEASRDLEALYKKHPDSDRIQFMSAVALEKIGKLDEALVRYEGIAEESSVKLPSEYRRVLILKQQNKNQESVDLAKSLTKRTDADSVTWQILIELIADLKRYEEAREIAATAVNLFPEKTHLLFLKGVYEERAGRMVDAEESMRKVVSQNGKHAAALNFLGYMLAEQNRNLDEAEKLIQRALTVKPGDGSYLDSLGWVYYQKKEYKKALEVLLKAKESSPKEGVIFEHIGDCYLQLRDPLSASQNFEMALTLDLEEREKVRIQLKLDQARRQLK